MTFKTLCMAILIISDNPIIIYTIGHIKGMIFQFIIFFFQKWSYNAGISLESENTTDFAREQE